MKHFKRAAAMLLAVVLSLCLAVTAFAEGTAEAKGYVGIVALGDASIQAAAREAGITRIHHVDYQAKSYVGVYTIYTIIVYGD